MGELLERREHPVLEVDPEGPDWQRGSVFNASVLRFDDGWRMLVRCTAGTEFGQPGSYTSVIAVGDSDDGIRWNLRDQPLIVPTLPEEQGLGCEDPRATVIDVSMTTVDTAQVQVFYNAAELRSDWSAPHVRVMSATLSDDLSTVEKHGVFLESESKDIRIKAAALFPRAADEPCNVVFTFASESPHGTLMLRRDLAVQDLRTSIEPARLADMFVNRRDSAVLLAPPAPVERGPEVGASPIRYGDYFVMFHCPANSTPDRSWTVGALLVDAYDLRVIGELTDLIAPNRANERHGVVQNVAFPSAAVVDDDGETVHVFYGGGDSSVLAATGRLGPIVDALLRSPPSKMWPY